MAGSAKVALIQVFGQDDPSKVSSILPSETISLLNPLPSLSSPRSNDPLTPEQIAALRESISARQRDAESAKESIEKEQLKLSIHSAAIGHLEPAILRAKQALIAQENLLNNFAEMSNEIRRAYTVPSPDWGKDSEARGLCLAAMSAIDTQMSLSAQNLAKDSSQLEGHLSHLRITIEKMEMEVSSRRFMQAMSSQYISETQKHKDTIEKNIGILKSWLNYVKDIPAEIWAKIFSLRVHADLAAFLASPRDNRMPVTAVHLSHVSRFWRNMVLRQKSLWQFVPIDKEDSWTLSKLELFRHFLGCSGKDTTLVCKPSEYQPYYYYSRESVGANKLSMLDKYSLYIITGNDYVDMSSIVFRQPKILKLQFPAEPERLATLLGTFSEFSGLEISVQAHHQPVEMVLSAVQQQLIYLKLDMTTFDPFDVTTYLGTNLEELHIKHSGISSIFLSTTPLRLPQLKVLGVTPPDTDFTQSLELPVLKRIILHSPKSSDIAVLSLVQFSDNPDFKRVRDLELREWPLFKHEMEDVWSIMTPVGGIVDKMRSIESLRCVDSVIDGHELVKLVSALKDPTNTTVSKLENVIIDCCTGITREQCDTVSALVGKMEVYV